MANPTKNMNRNLKSNRGNNTPVEKPDVEERVDIVEEEMEEVKEPTFQFIHANKSKYIPPKYINGKGIQFVGGKFNTDNVELARYISAFHGVICIAGEDYL